MYQMNPQELSKLRVLQVQTVLNKFQHARVINNDTLDLPFTLGNVTCALRCYFPPAFPQQPPTIFLLGLQNVVHSCLALNNQVQYPKLQKWGPHSILANFLAEICQMFLQDPPRPQQQQQANLANTNLNLFHTTASMANLPTLMNNNNNSFSQQPQPQPQPSQQQFLQQSGQRKSTDADQQKQQVKNKFTGLTTLPTSFPEISQLDENKIRELCFDDEGFEEFFNSLEVVRNLNSLYVDTKKENDSIAQKTLDKQKIYDALKADVEQSKIELKKVGNAYDQKVAIYQEKQRQKTPAFLQQEMRKLIKEADDKSSGIAEDFLKMGKEANVQDFLKNFMLERQKFYFRQAKLDRALKI